MWIPGYEQRYNHGLNPDKTSALTRSIRDAFYNKSKPNPGYPPYQSRSIMTLDIFVKARIQAYSPPQLQGTNPASNVVIDLANINKKVA